jgi:putative acetyltransferase
MHPDLYDAESSPRFLMKHRIMTTIRRANFPADTLTFLDIWREYVASPSVSLDYQGNDAEFEALPGKYAAPSGCVLLADHDGRVDGCIAYRGVRAGLCEMKRLYVRPRARGGQLGQALVSRLIDEARTAGYQEMRLDVLEEFASARRLYKAFGFVPAEPVSYNPIPGTAFLGLRL